MSAPLFSILHATRGRPEKAVAAMLDTWSKAAMPDQMEYIVAANDDDAATIDAFGKHPDRAVVVFGPYHGSAEAWDWAAKISKGEVLIQMQDDLVLPAGWDRSLTLLLREIMPPWSEQPRVIRVSDGFRKDDLICTAIVNRARYEQQGCFLWPEFQSVFSDDEFTVRAMRDAEFGKCRIIDARHITFRHDNPYHLKQPSDATHERQNSPEAYAMGEKLFWERNPWARKYRTWV